MEASETGQQPTPEEIAKAQQVMQAAGIAVGESTAQGGGKEEARQAATRAVESKADEVNLKLSKDDVHSIVDEMIDRMNAMGVFDPPPATEAPATTAAVAAATPEAAAAAEAAAAETAAPQKRTFAERFAGLG